MRYTVKLHAEGDGRLPTVDETYTVDADDIGDVMDKLPDSALDNEEWKNAGSAGRIKRVVIDVERRGESPRRRPKRRG